jgi:hypothetical protein
MGAPADRSPALSPLPADPASGCTSEARGARDSTGAAHRRRPVAVTRPTFVRGEARLRVASSLLAAVAETGRLATPREEMVAGRRVKRVRTAHLRRVAGVERKAPAARPVPTVPAGRAQLGLWAWAARVKTLWVAAGGAAITGAVVAEESSVCFPPPVFEFRGAEAEDLLSPQRAPPTSRTPRAAIAATDLSLSRTLRVQRRPSHR